MKINMHERIPMKRECEVYRVNYSYLTQRKNKRTSSCEFTVLKSEGKSKAYGLFYEALYAWDKQEKYKKILNAKILSVEFVEETEIVF